MVGSLPGLRLPNPNPQSSGLMARKKSHPARPASRSEPAGAASVSVSTAAASPGVTRSGSPNRSAKDKAEDRFWLEVVVVKMSRWLGSLQMAVVLLLLFAFVLAIGTMVESWYSGQAAQELVYRTWWFTLLLALLGVNIFFAA